MEGEGFEPSKAEPSDLQSDPFDRSGTPPNKAEYYARFLDVRQTIDNFFQWDRNPKQGFGSLPPEQAQASRRGSALTH